MSAVLAISSGLSLGVWLILWLLPWQPHRTRERLGADPAGSDDLSRIAVVIPARDEAQSLETTLAALAHQGRDLRVIVVDDESADGTADVAHRAARALALRLEVTVVSGTPPPPDWGGKLWALQQGLEHVQRELTLLLDADIELAPGVLPRLLADRERYGATLYSVMATLRARTVWERLLVPPFIFFFKLLYPFALANAARSRVAAAAGGLILVETAVLRQQGGFEPIRDALIDDCSLAAAIKRRGYATRLVLSDAVVSQRAYDSLGPFWRMVSRTAFTQLRYSAVLLVLVTLAMLALFVAPLVALIADPWSTAALVGALAWLAMALAFSPVVLFYRLPWPWTLTLPVAAVLFLAMTWGSALGYWRGTKATWKSRAYQVSR